MELLIPMWLKRKKWCKLFVNDLLKVVFELTPLNLDFKLKNLSVNSTVLKSGCKLEKSWIRKVFIFLIKFLTQEVNIICIIKGYQPQKAF